MLGGGQNIGYLNPGDYLDYYINAAYSGSFQVSYRNASNGFNGGLELQLIDSLGNVTILDEMDFSSTGGWQDWVTTISSEVFWLDKGIYHIRIVITGQEFNLNWFEFGLVVSDQEIIAHNHVKLYPNPSNGLVNIVAENEFNNIKIYDLLGNLVLNKNCFDKGHFFKLRSSCVWSLFLLIYQVIILVIFLNLSRNRLFYKILDNLL